MQLDPNPLVRRRSSTARRLASGVALVALLAAGAAGLAHAMPPPGGDPALMGLVHGGRGLDRMLDAVQATPAQREQIRAIADAARTDLKAQHDAARNLHEQARSLFVQPTVDAAAAESLRQQMLAQHDQVSRRMLQAMLDVANVLTPEQRQRFADQAASRHADRAAGPHRGEPAPNPTR